MASKIKRKIYDRGFHHHRTIESHTQALRERAFAEVWREEAGKVVPALFVPRSRMGKGLYNFFASGSPILNLDRLHRAMIATVVQWFGSNVGFSFLERALCKCGYSIIRTEALDEMRQELVELRSKQE